MIVCAKIDYASMNSRRDKRGRIAAVHEPISWTSEAAETAPVKIERVGLLAGKRSVADSGDPMRCHYGCEGRATPTHRWRESMTQPIDSNNSGVVLPVPLSFKLCRVDTTWMHQVIRQSVFYFASRCEPGPSLEWSVLHWICNPGLAAEASRMGK